MAGFMVGYTQGPRWVFQQELAIWPALPVWGAGEVQSLWGCPEGPFEPPPQLSVPEQSHRQSDVKRVWSVFLSSRPVVIAVM